MPNVKETLNLVRDTTAQELVSVHKAQLRVSAVGSPAIDYYYQSLVQAVTSVAEMDKLFCEWWHLVIAAKSTLTKSEMLERWFGVVLDDERVHGVKFPLFSTSQTAIGELTDDSVGLTCTPSTEETAGQDDFAYLPQFWCLEVSAEKNADGSHVIYAVEHIDDYDTVRNGTHLCWVLQKNTYTREWDADGYRYFKMRAHPAMGYASWPQGTDRTGKQYAYIANPKYAAGLDSSGKITCGTGLAPVLYTSHNALVALWRTRGSQYSGASGNLLKFQLAMVWLKYARKGNSGTIEGCSSYNYQYKAAISETGVKRVLLTPEQAANIHVGSNVIVGSASTSGSIDRWESSMRSLVNCKRVRRIESVTVSGTTYSAVYIDTATAFDTVGDATYISTMPYYSGWNDTVQGFDGSRYSPTNGKEPGLIQKTEFQNGAYIIISDELWKWGKDSAGNYTFDCYTCHDQTKVTTDGSISTDYTLQDDLTLTFASDVANGWQYIEDTAVADDRGVLWPAGVSQTAGSGTGCKAGFYVYKADDAIRAAWCCAYLGDSGHCGLPARDSYFSTTYSNWSGGGGSPGLAG